jgi:hypothetical protein
VLWPAFVDWRQERNQHTISSRENRAGEYTNSEESHHFVAPNERAAPLRLGNGRCFCVFGCATSLTCHVSLSGRSVGRDSRNDATPLHPSRPVSICGRIVSHGSAPRLNQHCVGSQIYSVALFLQGCSSADCIPLDKRASIPSRSRLPSVVFLIDACS